MVGAPFLETRKEMSLVTFFNLTPSSTETVATFLFALAIIHTFLCSRLQHWAGTFPEGSIRENVLHLLGEVEVVFGIWAGIFILYFIPTEGFSESVRYLESRNFTEPMFVFTIMVICASRPILEIASKFIRLCGQVLPVQQSLGFYFATLVIGPLLGSFITEPAAMTVTALLLLQHFYSKNISSKLKYVTLGLLFVNISIGGTLTPFAAPPVLMVASKWNWDFVYMLTHFGWKALIAMLISTSIVSFRFKDEIKQVTLHWDQDPSQKAIPAWVTFLHLFVLACLVATSHYMVLFVGIFLLFLGVATVTKEYHTELRLRESLLVGFFLGGLVILGGLQSWWISPVLTKLTTLPLYMGSMALTAFTDNAAITYLGSQVPNLTEISKYALVAGSVVGGGLTVIANAPNPAGFSTLNSSFGPDGISPLSLFAHALLPTLIAALCFWFL